MLHVVNSWLSSLAGGAQTFESVGEALEQHCQAQRLLAAAASRYRASYLADGFIVRSSASLAGGSSARRFLARELLLDWQGAPNLKLRVELSLAPAKQTDEAYLTLAMRLGDLAHGRPYAPVLLGAAPVPLRTRSARASLDAGLARMPIVAELLTLQRAQRVQYA